MKSIIHAGKSNAGNPHVRVIKTPVLAAAALTLAFVVYGDATDYSDWFQQAVHNVDVFTSACWVDPGDETQTKVTATSGNSYYVPPGMTALTPTANSTFPDAALAVAGTLQLRNYNTTHTFNDLRLLAGAELKHNSYNYIAGNVTIEGTVESPARMNIFYYGMNNHFEYRANFSGGAGAVVRTGSATASVTREKMEACYLGISGSWGNFFGRWIIGSNTCARLSGSAKTFPGTISIERNGLIRFPDSSSFNVTIGDLDLGDGSMVKYVSGNHGLVTVTNSLNISGSPLFILGCDIPVTNVLHVLRLSGAAAQNAPDVSNLRLELGYSVGNLIDDAHAVLRDNGDGTKDVCFVWNDLVHMVTSNGSYDVAKSAFNPANASYWSTGEIPDSSFAGKVYCATRAIQWKGWSHFSYPEMSLYTRGNIYAHVHSLNLREIVVLGDLNLYTYSGPSETEIKAPLKLNGHQVGLRGRESRKMVLSGEVSGAGGLVIQWDGADGANFSADIKGINTNFAGRVHVYSRAGLYDAANGVDTAARMEFHDARNLGGVYEGADSWKALQVTGYSYVECSGDIVLSEPTRGLFVNGGARFNVPSGKTLEIDYPVTYGGEFMKVGPGSLVLGCAAPCFATTGVPYRLPIEGTTVLTVAGGSLRIAATNAVNGLAVSFAAGTALAVDPCPADADLRDYGAINTKWGAPFASTQGGAIPVSFLDRQFPDTAFSVAICTVSQTASETLQFDVPGTVKSRKCTVTTRTNPDGTVSFVADFSAKPGFILSFY